MNPDAERFMLYIRRGDNLCCIATTDTPQGLGVALYTLFTEDEFPAGARVETIANWHPNVVVDRELITGQQPMSAPAFGDTLVAKLNQHVQR